MDDSRRIQDCHSLNVWDGQEQSDMPDPIGRLAQIGVALSAEKNLDRLFEMIVDEARFFTHADGGALYLITEDEDALQFVIVQTDSLNIRMGGTSGQIKWPLVPLKNQDGSFNYANVSAYTVLCGSVVNIPDVYHAEGFNFEGTRQFDRNTGYRSQSMLVVPMRNHENEIIGVLQLLNARDPSSGEVIPFSLESQIMTKSLASQAAVALTNKRLIHDLETLLDSFIKSIGTAIDEKSPYTGDHVRRVAELTMTIAHRIDEAREGVYADVSFSEYQLRELHLAAWLHDLGKITTPEHVIDKSAKLEAVFNRMELLKLRFELVRCNHKIEKLRQALREAQHLTAEAPAGIQDESDDFTRGLDDDYQFLLRNNEGNEIMGDEQLERVKRIAGRKYLLNGAWLPLLTDNERENLSIRQGTLTTEERNTVNKHACVTNKILSQLPFPKKLRHVAQYASSHHERMNGTGYPNGLKGDQIPLQSRILALADIFEALTAKDRPYKKPINLTQALKIMGMMAKDGHIDAELLDFFMKERIYRDYVIKELALSQMDVAGI